MLKIYKLIKLVLVALLLLIFCVPAQAKSIKVALLDTPYNEMPLNLSLLSEYEKAYLAGVETAAHVAKKYNMDIEYKPFFYGQEALDILGETPKIEEWNADLVIGPSSSDQFTLLKNRLTNIMVLSSYASGAMLQTLPKNFYSIFLIDNKVSALLAAYIHKYFPEKNIYIISQADCKQCVDVGKLFITNYKKISTNRKIAETKIIMDNIDLIDSKILMAKHENDVTLIFNTTYYAYNSLVKHIAASFPDKKLIFFSDQDNWGNEINRTTFKKNNLSYESYRIGPLLLNDNQPDFKTFSEAYYKIYQTKPHDAVSYMTYRTIMSAVEALNKFSPNNPENNMRQKILQSYLAALKKDPNWFKVTAYGIYELTPQGEVLEEKLPFPD